ncbi:MAG: oxidoreductase [Rhodospirillales bacterium]|nr:oxidoreductase [Rhodospirillales bacterium]
MSTGRVEGKVAVVLGVAAGNMGCAIAKRLVEEGAKVMVAGRRQEPLEQAALDIGAASCVCDITVAADIARLIRATLDRFGRIDVGINATGWGLLKPFFETTREDLELMAAIQFTGPFQYFQALVKAMPPLIEGKGGGSLMQISSVTATIMFDNHAAYMGTKAGMDHVMRTIAHEFGGQGIRANSIAPGGTADTPMSGGGLDFPAVAKLYAREIPLQRTGVALDIANAALWLASDESSFVTGQTIQVNGGQTLRRNPSIGEVYAAFGAAG